MLIVKVVRGNLNKDLKNYKMKFKKSGLLKELRERQQQYCLDLLRGL